MLSLSRKFVGRRSIHRNRRTGAIVVLVAVCLTVILAFVAIAIDGGGLLEQRRQAQATADAAAMAAAEDLFRNYPKNKGLDTNGTATSRATAIAAANGFNNDGVQSIVTTRTSPQTYLGGPNEGATIPKGLVEVTVQYNQPRYFSSIMGMGAIPVTARAVGRGKWEPAYVGIHVLDLHARASLYGNGEAVVNVTGGAKVIVNSDDPEAAVSTGATMTASEFDITGGINGGSKGGFFGDITLGANPEPDPLRAIPEPDINGYSVQSHGPIKISNGSRTLLPGTYRGGISVSGKGSLTMAPGVYYMDGGGFSFSGQGDLAAAGVMIYNAPTGPSDCIDIGGTGSIVMSPPTTGIYQGLTLFQERAATNEMSVSGGGYMNVTGTFYAAGARLKVAGGGDSKVGSQYISRFLDIVGNGTLRIDYDPTQAIPRRIIGLVE
jgi:Flp pilus assembly protein TadG